MRATIHADGCSLGNPGPAGLGAHIICSGKTTEIAEPLGKTTNNVAEYSALIRGLEAALDMQATEADVFMDSELVVKQMLGLYKVKHDNIKPLHAKASALAKKFRKFTIRHIPREKNAEADKLSKLGAEMPLEAPKKTSSTKPQHPPAKKSDAPSRPGTGSNTQGSLF